MIGLQVDPIIDPFFNEPSPGSTGELSSDFLVSGQGAAQSLDTQLGRQATPSQTQATPTQSLTTPTPSQATQSHIQQVPPVETSQQRVALSTADLISNLTSLQSQGQSTPQGQNATAQLLTLILQNGLAPGDGSDLNSVLSALRRSQSGGDAATSGGVSAEPAGGGGGGSGSSVSFFLPQEQAKQQAGSSSAALSALLGKGEPATVTQHVGSNDVSGARHSSLLMAKTGFLPQTPDAKKPLHGILKVC